MLHTLLFININTSIGYYEEENGMRLHDVIATVASARRINIAVRLIRKKKRQPMRHYGRDGYRGLGNSRGTRKRKGLVDENGRA